jgi:hypothetical protein
MGFLREIFQLQHPADNEHEQISNRLPLVTVCAIVASARHSVKNCASDFVWSLRLDNRQLTYIKEQYFKCRDRIAQQRRSKAF